MYKPLNPPNVLSIIVVVDPRRSKWSSPCTVGEERQRDNYWWEVGEGVGWGKVWVYARTCVYYIRMCTQRHTNKIVTRNKN